ncbi:forkhead box protein N4 isoform X2 [Nematostella vectensis]|uniref:forkhead box protein N4 isoform X2 n=1 Tax=Nematostella vectensis TaxID=45351 RepID=UPI00138F9F18|nr:forkhead box protein N4 isoform X2 [Nematostella vectensis]
MYSMHQTYYLDGPDQLSLQEMMEGDMREMDLNFNDPMFQEQNIFCSPEGQRALKAEQERPRTGDCISPGDLTNLQWLQNVSIPMEKGSNGQEKPVMVDPNTVMPVQWQHQQQPTNIVSSVAVTSVQQQAVTPLAPQTQLTARVSDNKTRMENCKVISKENAKPNEKCYPKPLFSYSCLIAMALKNSDSGTLPVSEIYKFMMGKFPYFKTAPDGWKNSVRHNLSLNKAFCKLERPQGASQRKGCLWSLKPERRDQMDKEIKKWKKKHAEAIRASMAHPELQVSSDDLEDTEHLVPQNQVEDLAAADAAKELFGNDLIQEIQQHDVLDWDDIISSGNDLNLDPHITTTTMAPTINGGQIHPDPITTTVELDNSSHFYMNGDQMHHEYDQSAYVNNYFTLQPQQLAHLNGF